MKSLFFVLAICWLATSCSRGYGCPYSSSGTTESPLEIKQNIKKEAVPNTPIYCAEITHAVACE